MFSRLFCFIGVLYCGFAWGQENKVAVYHLKKEQIKLSVSSTKNFESNAQKAVNYFRIKGYVGITLIDSVVKKDVTHYYFNSEKQFKKVELENAKDVYYTTILSTPNQINSFLVELENSGFPFASISITDQTEKENNLKLTFKIDSGQYMPIRKIIIKSPDSFNQKTIQNLIHIKPGEPYNESKIKAISNLFSQGNMYELIRMPELLFLEKGVDLYLTIKKKNASLADGFIGFQQNPESFKLELNGNVNLSLKNGLNRGELLDFKWQSNPDKSQNLDIVVAYPFIANLPIGAGGEMTIQKQDTTFIRNSFLGSIKYLASQYTVGIFAQSENSFLLGANQNSTNNFAAFRRITYGFDGTLSPNVTKKYQPIVNFKVGAFSLRTDSIDSEASNSNLLIDISITQRIKLIKSFYFQNTTRFQDIISSNELSRNQQFYFGGLKSVRGFYELELNGNHVLSVNNSIIFRPVKQLSFELIYDYSQYHASTFNRTHSAGMGFNIENETNTLSLILANGTIAGNGFNFQNSKLHIGFISRF
ncbi:MAG: ShlB/FhaC/HecB family hemolysin secretion/activation protein [Crocinitomicaceae bacterium]